MQFETHRTEAIPYVIASSGQVLGKMAAMNIAEDLRTRLASQPSVTMIFAAAPSQSEMLASLITEPGIDWCRVTAFHMDEYLGLPADSPQRFASWLDRHLFQHLPFAAVHRIQPEPNPEETARAYADALAAAPIDIVCCGIGTNGHLAFNDPPADFSDREAVKIVALDQVCRQQQVDDQCFDSIGDVPTHAMTLTVPVLLSAQRIFCSTPGASKRDAVASALLGPLTELCPASALRTHANCKIYLDPESAAGLHSTNCEVAAT